MAYFNELGQPIGSPLSQWKPPPWLAREPRTGDYCRLQPLDPVCHAKDLFAANAEDRSGAMWTYLAYGPFPEFSTYYHWLEENSQSRDPLFFTILDREIEKALGLASYLRISPENGSFEIGHLAFSPAVQRTRIATEALFLMMQQGFRAGYRRCEWKCDSLNAPSRAAAERLGFSFEGIFRQATVYKARNRDTAWYSIIDREWPTLEKRFLRWLAASNFDATGRQKRPLRDFISC